MSLPLLERRPSQLGTDDERGIYLITIDYIDLLESDWRVRINLIDMVVVILLKSIAGNDHPRKFWFEVCQLE